MGIACMLGIADPDHYEFQCKPALQAMNVLRKKFSDVPEETVVVSNVRRCAEKVFGFLPSERMMENPMCKLGRMIGGGKGSTTWWDLLDVEFPLISLRGKGLFWENEGMCIGNSVFTLRRDGGLRLSESFAYDVPNHHRRLWMMDLLEETKLSEEFIERPAEKFIERPAERPRLKIRIKL